MTNSQISDKKRERRRRIKKEKSQKVLETALQMERGTAWICPIFR